MIIEPFEVNEPTQITGKIKAIKERILQSQNSSYTQAASK
jgi:hypothetical protein